MEDELAHYEVARRSVKELTIAFIATLITMIIAYGLFKMVPLVRSSMVEQDRHLQHERQFIPTTNGGRIEYSGSGQKATPEELNDYRQDLEILSRRFARGQFELAMLPGFRNSSLFRDLQANTGRYLYSVRIESNKTVLNIEARGGGARKALHAYLKYLQERWHNLPENQAGR